MKLQRIILTCLLVLLPAAPAAPTPSVPYEICTSSLNGMLTFYLKARMKAEIQIKAVLPRGSGNCFESKCSGGYRLYVDSPCGNYQASGIVTYGHRFTTHPMVCPQPGNVTIHCISGCIQVRITFSQ